MSLLGLLFIIIKSPKLLVYDEPYHLNTTSKVLTLGWLNAFNSHENQSAAGPLFSAIQLVFYKITNLAPPKIRYINFVTLILIIFIIQKTLKLTCQNKCDDPLQGLFILSVPFLWPAVGMALTEIPALFFFCCFILSLRNLLEKGQQKNEQAGSILLSIITGTCLGISILGRQTYLVAVPLLIIFAISKRLKISYVSICVLAALMTSGWLFLFWGGLVPPSQVEINKSLKPQHGLYSLAYVGIASAIISPQSILPTSVKKGFWLFILGILLCLVFQKYDSLPAQTALFTLFGQTGGKVLGTIIIYIMVVLGLFWIFKIVSDLLYKREDVFNLYVGTVLLALAATPIKISHMFSSRYSVGLLGLLIILLKPEINIKSGLRLIFGSAIGAVILLSYYR